MEKRDASWATLAGLNLIHGNAYGVPMQTELVSLSSSLHVLSLFKKCIIALATIVIVVFSCSQPSSSFSTIIHNHSSVH